MVNIGGGDGSTFENAIYISECTNMEGINQEYEELKIRFGTYKSVLNHSDKK